MEEYKLWLANTELKDFNATAAQLTDLYRVTSKTSFDAKVGDDEGDRLKSFEGDILWQDQVGLTHHCRK